MPKRRKAKNAIAPVSMKLNSVKFGLAGGFTTAICIFVTTLAAVLKPEYGAMWAGMIKDIYGFMGYDSTMAGAFLGAACGFVDGFIMVWIFALIYNRLVK